jgi:arachidonate 15-lipoxygenase
MNQPSLPQNDTAKQRLARDAQLLVAREGYQYEKWDGIPMQMASTSAALLSLPSLRTWLEGQAKNLLRIFVNIEVWKILRKVDSNENTLPELAKSIEKLEGSDLGKQFKQDLDFPKMLESMAEKKTNPIELLASKIHSGVAAHKPLASEEFNSTAEYTKVFEVFDTPTIVEQWQDDRIFASQRLAGLNPMIIQRVSIDGTVGIELSRLKSKMNNAMEQALAKLLPGMSLEQATTEKRLFVADYHALGTITADADTIGVFAGKRPYAPIVLYVKTDDFEGLNLAAIQLDQRVGSNDTMPVMLAAQASLPGKANKWLMAKCIVQAADLSYNQSVNHLGMTHLLEEAFAVATHRHLASGAKVPLLPETGPHPLYVLFTHHFTALFAINELGKLTLLKTGPEGLINQLLEVGTGGVDGQQVGATALITDAYNNWSFDQLDFNASLATRGLEEDVLPYFPYRDDGKNIWDILGAYISEYLALYYTCDSDVTADSELQAWAKELRNEGGIPSLPEIDSVESLANVVQKIIWTAGPQHAAVNFPQIDYSSFMPNCQGAPNYLPDDFDTADISREDLLKMLPTVSQTAVQVQVSYTLAGYHYDQLLDYSDDLYPNASQVCNKYFDQLQGPVSDQITQRNVGRTNQQGMLAYPYFLPKNIPNSTSV